MTLVLKLHLDIIVTNFHTKMGSIVLKLQKLCLGNIEKIVLFDACDLEYHLIILVLKSDMNNMMTYFDTKNEVNRLNGSEVMA